MILNNFKKTIFLLIILMFILIIDCAYAGTKCENLEKEINNQIESLNYCQEDSDCKAVSFNCPFGCYRFINKNINQIEIYNIKKLSNKFTPKCGLCMYKCPSFPKINEIKCFNNKCIDVRWHKN